jgi:YfiH family protein
MLHRRRTDSGLTFYISPLLQQAGVPHAFSTRLGGISPAPFDSLNLGITSGLPIQDDIANIQENYRRLRQAIGCSDRDRCWVHQVHGPDVCFIRPDEPFESGRKADAMITDDPHRVLSVKYADCVPILLSTRDGRAVAAVHAGWRGVVSGVLPASIRKLTELSGDPSATIVAAVGPCIGFEAFEVGPEVLAEFTNIFGDRAPVRRSADKGHVDLQAAVRLQLLDCGLLAANIDATDRCTYRDRDEFFSHRRERGLTGRMAAIIGPVKRI